MMNDNNKKEINKSIDSHEIMLDRSEKKFKILFENSPIGMAMVSHKTGDFLEVNQSLLDSIGYEREEFLKLSYWDITPREYDQQEMDQIEELNSTGKFGPNFKEYIRKDGSRYPIRISGFILTDVDGSKVVWGIIEDISKQRSLENELRYQAYHDELTGLPNRRMFYEKFYEMIDNGLNDNSVIGLLSIDLDGFKSVNDNYGHLIGDILLHEVSDRISQVMIGFDSFLARVGGDEFLLIINGISIGEDALDIGIEICKVLGQAFLIEENLISITASIGCSIFPEDSKDTHLLRKYADDATYDVKNSGGNSCIRYKKK